MSVTFTPANTDHAVRTFLLTCNAQGQLGEWTGLDNAYTEAHAHALVCNHHLCRDYGADVDEITDGPGEINLNQANAKRVLCALGYVTGAELAADEDAPTVLGIRFTGLDMYGQDAAESFLGRVLLALAVSPADEGMPAHEVAHNVTEGGRGAGYLQRVLADLHELAAYCATQGTDVAWA
jgi:hypothetical protein